MFTDLDNCESEYHMRLLFFPIFDFYIYMYNTSIYYIISFASLIIVKRQRSNLSAVSWREQVTVPFNDIMMMPDL